MATILIVDDRPANREFLVTLLGYGGHRLLQAGDGAEALAVTRAEGPDLVIADILMPTMDGYEFVRRLRADPAVAHTPVVFCTAHYHEHEAQALAAACGVAGVLTKPCDPEVVLRTVAAVLGLGPPPAPPAPDPAEFAGEHLRVVTDKLSQKADELRRANERMKSLVEHGLQLGSERDPARLLQGLGHAAREVTGARFAVVGVADDGLLVRRVFTSGMDPETAARLAPPLSASGPLRTVLADAAPVRGRNPAGAAPASDLPAGFPPARSWLAVPVLSPTRVYGWLCLTDKFGADGFGVEDERLAEMLAAQVGRVYENSTLYAEVVRQAEELRREVAERKRAEDELRLRDRAISAVSQGILIADPNRPDDPVVYASPGFERVTGYSAGEAVGRNCRFLQGPGTDPAAVAEVRAAIREGRACTVELLNYRKDGTPFWNALALAPVLDEAGRMAHVVGVQVDVTERRKLEEQLRQSQKLEAVGRLAGGIAHDFNNLLTVINGYSEILLSGLDARDPQREPLDEIRKAGERAAGLTRQLLAFSRKQVLAPEILDPGSLLRNLGKMLSRLIGEDVDLRVAADPGVGKVKADPGQLEQVVMNLAVNARDAMPTGGKLTIETRNADLDEGFAAAHPETAPGPYVLIAVSDTGVGMTDEVKAKIFDPFFTTKGEFGTGLGLAVVHGIVRQSGGRVDVYSELGIGTTFKVYLPRVGGEPTPKRASTAAPVLRGTEHVLLVEDESGVRSLTRMVLERYGYTVTEARNGREALDLCLNPAAAFHLVVTDMVMPDVSGWELARRLETVRPGLKVLYLSGYTDDAVVRHGILTPDTPFLQKPFTPEALAIKVREVLG